MSVGYWEQQRTSVVPVHLSVPYWQSPL